MASNGGLSHQLGKFLAPHVRVCDTVDSVVLLDTRRNRYSGLSPEEARSLLAELTRAATAADDINLTGAAANSGRNIKEQMQRLGMLCEVPEAEAESTTVPEVHSALYDGFPPFRAPLTPAAFRNVFIAYLEARKILWSGDIERHIKNVDKRALANDGARAFSIPHLQALVASYLHCRAWLFAAAGECLLDSLTLHSFLSRHGIASSLVIGVRTSPFGAHAWVQRGGCVLNDECETVNAYKRIYVSPGTSDIHRHSLD
jgi:hypothetical protein